MKIDFEKYRRQRSIEVRQGKTNDKTILVQDYKSNNPNATVRDIAEALQIPKSTVDRLLKR